MYNKDNFECKNCGLCCKPLVIISKKDIIRIKKLGYSDEDFIQNDIFGKGKVLKQNNNVCVFLDLKNGKSKCKIYENRPDVCRNYPFFDNKVIKDCKPNMMFEKSIQEAKELLNKRGFI